MANSIEYDGQLSKRTEEKLKEAQKIIKDTYKISNSKESINEEIKQYNETHKESKKYSEVYSKYPIIWFGDIVQYLETDRKDRVVVIGKNPSTGEFKLSKFEREISDKIPKNIEASLYEYYNKYFDKKANKANQKEDGDSEENDYLVKWFDPIITDLKSLGIHYCNNEECNEAKAAIHIDFASPFAMKEKWGDLPSGQKNLLIKRNKNNFSKLFQILDPAEVIFLGGFGEVPLLLQQILYQKNNDRSNNIKNLTPSYAIFELSKLDFKLIFIRNGQNPGGKLKEAVPFLREYECSSEDD